MNIDERIKIGFDQAASTIKQILTLSTAIVTITSVAAKSVFDDVSSDALTCLGISWIFFILSIISGVMGLMSLAGNVAPENLDEESPSPSIYNRPSAIIIKCQLIAFLVGIIFVVLYGYFSTFL